MVSKVVGKKETSKPDRGVITFQRKVINQSGVIVQELEASLMYKRRPQPQ
jgi:acyl dehydratase